MLQLVKHLKKSVVSIIAIVILLLVQATCDLSLPEYTSDIVNIGIQQGGVKDAVLDVIRRSELEKITLIMNEKDKEKVLDSYELIDRGSLSKKEYDTYKEKYPALEDQELYRLRNIDEESRDKLSSTMSKYILITSILESDSKEIKLMKDSIVSKLPPQLISKDADIFGVLSVMNSNQRQELIKGIEEKIDDMPESMITQSATSYVKSEYENIGINTEKVQNNYILITGIKMIAITLLSVLAAIMVGFLASRVAASVGKNLRSGVFRKVMSFSNEELEKFSIASLITRSTNDIQQVQMLLVMLLRIVFYAPILGIGGVFKVLKTNTSMSWIIGVALVAILILISILFAVVMPRFKIVQKLVDKLNLVSREILTGIPVIRAFSTEKYEEQRFDKANKDLTKLNTFVNRVMACMMPSMMLVMNLIGVLIVWRGAYSIDAGNMQVGDMMAFIQYTMQIIMSFLMISMVSVMLPRASVSLGRIDEILSTDLSITDPIDEKNMDLDKKGLVEFKNVSFKYPNAEEEVLKNISFTAKPGETTAFIGSTGSGKSTLVNLIPRFFDVTEGEILVDGVDVREISQSDLRDKIGYVPQKGVLFSGTIESNLRYAKEDATDEELKKAISIAQATEFVESKPEGIETEISQGGTNVSGGQKQRLSIARAIVKNPEIYIFDDSFSALDFKTDAKLRKALKSETSGSTVLIVAQRISTILNAEQIIVLDEGEIVGVGSHENLLKNCEVYKQIALSQLSKEELADE
ncbi:ABC transporter ATP-binding protein [Asaccharospora irregularis]|uniref:ATP-binding cassette, subfamily B n=1 Tax=Asaccharospora irregularis DSM 2635 TaxID=1121321 RepID=A0A1M5MYV4_9FIRM|nr:ABC transporter ATP-binding protein [Asaccharospora irregularis]SHG82407.1 ATP-binding cassette, subfamily B [Asaccharospora irregularis DSM 2635]